jgi:hypothetical protein
MRAELYLCEEFTRRGVKPTALVAAVDRTAARIAGEINRRGLEDQIAYLLDDGLTADQVRALAGLAAERKAA